MLLVFMKNRKRKYYRIVINKKVANEKLVNKLKPAKQKNIFMKYFTSKVVVCKAIYRLIVYFWRPEPTHLGLFPS